jgi:CheY-like chemotaxis protein
LNRKLNILLVEDETVIALALQSQLEYLGHRVTLAATSEQALRSAAALRPDVVLMDINLPGRANGVDTAQRICDRRAVDIIFLSGHAIGPVRERGDVCKPLAYLSKPFEFDELRAELARVRPKQRQPTPLEP